MTRPSADLPHSKVWTPSASPPEPSVRSSRSCRPRGFTAKRSMRSAVGATKALRTPAALISQNASSGSNFSILFATTGTPKCRLGSSTSSRPPAQAQSDGVQNRSPGCGKKSCGSSTPGKCPSSTRWPCKAPFGGPVAGTMGEADLRDRRQENRAGVAARDAVGGERVGKPVGALFQPAVADLLARAVGEQIDQRQPVRIALRPPIAHVDADVVARRHLPAEFPVELVVVCYVRQHGRFELIADYKNVMVIRQPSCRPGLFPIPTR